MSILKVDKEKCKKDGICKKECPWDIIHLDTDDGYPALVEGGAELCITCGHCVAACPHDAMSHQDVPIDASPLIQKELSVGIDQVEQFLRSRRSIRAFKDKPVEKETVQHLIEIARYAPTGENAQAINWMVYTDPAEIKKLSEMAIDWMRHMLDKEPEKSKDYMADLFVEAWDAGYDEVLFNAPCLVIAQAEDEAITAQQDCDIALTYFELAAKAMGLGTCWNGILAMAVQDWKPLKEAMELSNNYFYPMVLGYPKLKYRRLPERKKPNIIWK